MTSVQLQAAEKLIIQTLRKRRAELQEHFGTVAFKEKADKTVVTALDSQIEADLRQVLRKFDSGIGIEGEELGVEGNRQTYWLLDPIDGTEQFIRGIPSCRTQICLIDNGQPVWSLVDFFIRDELCVAYRGKGATLNGQPLKLKFRSLERSWIDAGVPLDDPVFMPKLLQVRKLIAGLTTMRDPGVVATGRVDGSISFHGGGGPWDYAPRVLLYQEAGYRVANLGRSDYAIDDSSFLVAAPQHFDQLMELLS